MHLGPILSFAIFLWPTTSSASSFIGERAFTALSAGRISTLVSSPNPVKNVDPSNPTSHLSKIMIPRPPDTSNNTQVRNYIASTMKQLNWDIEEDEFIGETPEGLKKFTNVIATKDPKASRRVILAAHFDSKWFSTYPENQFVGATDSAAPCAMMLDLAEALNTLLDERQTRFEDNEEEDEDVADTTLQLVFFDGEEAYHHWTDTDSIYGATHLAEKWATTYIVPNSKRRLMGPQMTEMSTVEHLILLDLLGAPNPLIRSYFTDTAWLFDAIASVEQRLGKDGFFVNGDDDSMAPGRFQSYFRQRLPEDRNIGYMGDDHVPFLRRGVSILHLIAEPFPRVWHTLRDDASALDITTMRRWNLILRVFFSEYLNLRPEDASSSTLGRSASEL